MRTSSAALQLELEGIGVARRSDERRSKPASPIQSLPNDNSVARSTSLGTPEFGSRDPVYALTARLAGRVNASAVSDEEHQKLLSERQALLDKLLEGTISRRETIRLEYVRWSLDRIEDAKYGSALDVLTDAVGMYERFVDDLKSFQESVTQQVGASRPRKRGTK